MKKIVALVLVLAMASMASAALVLDITGSTAPAGEVNISDNLSVSLVDAVNMNIQPFGVGFSLATDYGDYVSHMVIPPDIGAGWTLNNPAGNGVSITGSGTYMFRAIPADDVLMNLTFHVDEPWSTMLTISVAGFYQGQDVSQSVTLHVIPEPVTIALLGLGGLFLRRRK